MHILNKRTTNKQKTKKKDKTIGDELFQILINLTIS
jgi:hypothetical protein